MKTIRIPKSHPVQPLKPGAVAKDKATCGTCGLSWDDGKATALTPAPAGRCPFEYFHVPAPQLDYVCKHCGSRNVYRDATAQWNVSAQAWEMVDVHDHADCGDCDGETTLQEIDLSKVTP
jgi:hypothetical protein